MDSFIKTGSGCIIVTLNSSGKEISVPINKSVEIKGDDGAKTVLSADSEGLNCKTEVPEEQAPFICKLRLPTVREGSCSSFPDLEAMIGHIRTAANGRL